LAFDGRLRAKGEKTPELPENRTKGETLINIIKPHES